VPRSAPVCALLVGCLTAVAAPLKAEKSKTLEIPQNMIWSSTPTAQSLVATSTNTPAGEAKVQVVDAFAQRQTTRLVIQSDRPLVIGRDIYVGSEEIPANIGAPLSRSGDLYYYSATIAGTPKIANGETVSLVAKKKPFAERMKGAVDQSGYFEGKFHGEITAVQGDHVMIDKGTLQEVHERDVYSIYDSSGHYRGLLEVRGIGDLQSSGILYNRFEDFHKRASEASIGDRIVFVGQRMQFGLGLEGGTSSYRPKFLDGEEDVGGGGLVWNITLAGGLGLEVMAGLYAREGRNEAAIEKGSLFLGGPIVATVNGEETRKAHYIAPIWLKKNFFYPSIVSPYIAAGTYWFQGRHTFTRTSNSGQQLETDTAKRGFFYPTIGAGVEFFPTRLFRPRISVRHFFGPDLGTLGVHFGTSITIYSLGVVASW
jgi:hypothetical protein